MLLAGQMHGAKPTGCAGQSGCMLFFSWCDASGCTAVPLLQVLGEVLQPGERLLVAHGGKGGRGVVAPSRLQKQQELKKEYKRAQVWVCRCVWVCKGVCGCGYMGGCRCGCIWVYMGVGVSVCGCVGALFGVLNRQSWSVA